jgi:transcriptional regulator with XRE-family HTH domain
MSDKLQAEKAARAKRARTLRALTGLSRADFEKETGIPRGTLQHWEDENRNGLTQAGAERLSKACNILGIPASFEWLMYGAGSGPKFSQPAYEPSTSTSETSKTREQAEKELSFFMSNHKNAIDHIVPDDSMTPRFIEGEVVAGVRYFKDDIEKVVGQDCIVVTKDGLTLLRNLKASDLTGHFTLVCNNPHTAASNPIIKDVELISAAPVIWARRVL